MNIITRIKNFFLVMKYPFLSFEKGHFKSTHLDCVPFGWRKMVVNGMLKELKKELKRDKIKGYHLLQVKEKWGELRWYDSGETKAIENIVRKYTIRSRYTCAICGKPATWESTGYILPLCDDCAAKHGKSYCVPIEDEPVIFYLYGDGNKTTLTYNHLGELVSTTTVKDDINCGDDDHIV